MKRLCVFYNKPSGYAGAKSSAQVEWIVCKECQQCCRRGYRRPLLEKVVEELKHK